MCSMTFCNSRTFPFQERERSARTAASENFGSGVVEPRWRVQYFDRKNSASSEMSDGRSRSGGT